MTENKAFRIPFIIKKQLKDRQSLHIIFLKLQYKVYRGASIFIVTHPFLMFHLFQKCFNLQVIPPPLFFKNSLNANINIYWTSDLNKYQLDLAKKSRLFWIKFKQFHIFSAYSKFHFSAYSKLLPQVMHSVSGVLPCAHVTCMG